MNQQTESKRARAALWGLQRLGDATEVEALIAALKDPYEACREQAVLALSRIRDKRAIEPLIMVLKDDDRGVRKTALINLRETFGLNIGSDHDAAMKLLKETSLRQRHLNEKMKLTLRAR